MHFILCAAALVSVFAAAPSYALTITFDSLEEPGPNIIHLPEPFDQGEFRFDAVDSTSVSALISWQQGHEHYNGSAALGAANASNIVLTRIDGDAFGALSVDLDSFFGARTIDLIGQLAGGGTVTQSFTTDAPLGGETVALSGFIDIVSLKFDAPGNNRFSNIAGVLDNVEIGSVPEPGTGLMLGIALGLSMSACRRRPCSTWIEWR